MDFYNIGVVVKAVINSIPTNNLPANFKTKVFPLVAPVGTTFPFCVYRRTSGRYIYDDKDYDKDETVTVQLKVITDTYASSVDIINKLSDAFVNYTNIILDRDNPIEKIDSVKLVESNEEFFDETYIQTIYLEFTYK